MKQCVRWVGLLIAVLLPGATPLRAVILHSTGDPAQNTSAPTGSLSNSGWQFEGQWGDFLGTPVSPKLFITARHVGGAVGGVFRFRGRDYVTTGVFDSPDSDLRLWSVCGTFPAFAPLYSGTSEIAMPAILFGRGTQRGAAVTVVNFPFTETKGWQWGPADGVQRWGSNSVTAVIDGNTVEPVPGGALGNLLAFTFDAGAGPHEATLSVGDSGGAAFILDAGIWKLAGIHYGVDGPFNTNTTGGGFFAAIFDQGGLYTGGDGNWSLTPETPINVPTKFYSTRVSDHVAWINSVINGPLPEDPAPMLQRSSNAAGPYTTDNSASVDPVAKTITAPIQGSPGFFRLAGCSERTITGVRVLGTNVVVNYQ
jgi:hypothetical protein